MVRVREADRQRETDTYTKTSEKEGESQYQRERMRGERKKQTKRVIKMNEKREGGGSRDRLKTKGYRFQEEMAR